MDISIIGSGVIGQSTGLGLQMKGENVLFYDIDKKKLDILREKKCNVTDKITYAVQNSDVIFICVPTPTVDGVLDFSYIKKATIQIGKALREDDNFKTITVRSTVLPSTTRCRVIPILKQYSKLKLGKDFGVCVNPEFLRECCAFDDFLNPSRIVIGELNGDSGDPLEKIYSSFNAPIIRTTLDTAEMIKYASNVFLATKISYFNEIYIICKKLGLDPDLVSETVSLDPRIGKYGIYGGKPFNGKCLPKDLEAFTNFVKSKAANPKLLEAVVYINKEIVTFCSKKSN